MRPRLVEIAVTCVKPHPHSELPNPCEQSCVVRPFSALPGESPAPFPRVQSYKPLHVSPSVASASVSSSFAARAAIASTCLCALQGTEALGTFGGPAPGVLYKGSTRETRGRPEVPSWGRSKVLAGKWARKVRSSTTMSGRAGSGSSASSANIEPEPHQLCQICAPCGVNRSRDR